MDGSSHRDPLVWTFPLLVRLRWCMNRVRRQATNSSKEKFVDGDIVSNEFVTIYKIINNVNISSIKLQKEEVSEARWFTKSELNALRDELKVIPHIEEFDLISNILGD